MKRTVAVVLCGLLLVQLLPMSVQALDYDPRQIRSQYDQVTRPESESWPWIDAQSIPQWIGPVLLPYNILTTFRRFLQDESVNSTLVQEKVMIEDGAILPKPSSCASQMR